MKSGTTRTMTTWRKRLCRVVTRKITFSLERGGAGGCSRSMTGTLDDLRPRLQIMEMMERVSTNVFMLKIDYSGLLVKIKKLPVCPSGCPSGC